MLAMMDLTESASPTPDIGALIRRQAALESRVAYIEARLGIMTTAERAQEEGEEDVAAAG